MNTTTMAEARETADRRFLDRAEPGRRDEDRLRADPLAPIESEKATMAGPGTFLLLLFAVLVIGVVAIRSANMWLAPMLNDTRKIDEAAKILALPATYLTYDLNIETRRLRRQHIRLLGRTPEVIVMGASHWQEAHESLMPEADFYNAHVHRDYYEDIVAVSHWLIESGRLPETLVISIRDNQFLPVSARRDFLWTPVLPDYRRAARFFGLQPHMAYAHGFTPQLRQMTSIPLLWANVKRDFAAPAHPHATAATSHPTLDALLPDGSIFWSDAHRASFTQERSFRMSMEHADALRDTPPAVDPEGVASVDAAIGFLTGLGVEVVLAHPPFNPLFWDAVEGSPYREGLKRIEGIAAALAERHGLRIVGGFDPRAVGCTADMYIDAEHSGPACLGKILAEVSALRAAARTAPEGN